MTCSNCGGTTFEPGFIGDSGQSSQGFVRWIAGPLERGLFGGARRTGRKQTQVDAFRCTRCSRLELFGAQEL